MSNTEQRGEQGPRRKVVSTIAGLQSFMCELSCGHHQNTGYWVNSWGAPRQAPKTMTCRKCALTRATTS